jgi:ribosomal protein S12 methylthiotransferase
MRGKHFSKPMDEVIAEARQLAADGVRELIIVAQDTTYYGMDLFGEPRLAELLRRLENEVDIPWIRLMYFYPMYITDELLQVLNSSRKIVPYIDMPLQHINDTMLRRMSRRVTRAETESLLSKLRQAIPGLALRTTFIVGFPGETEEQFAELEQFVREQKFDRMGAFTYSLEPDTPAALLGEHLAEQIKEERQARLMAVQREISTAYCAARMGSTLEVILDQPVPNQKNVWVARSQADAPDVDGLVFVTGGKKMKLQAGDIVRAEVVATQEYDLIAHAVSRV